MYKGIYTIEKYKAKLVNGEWVAEDLVDTIVGENVVTPEMLYRFHNSEGTDAGSMRVFANEVDHTGAIMAWLSPAEGWLSGSGTVGGTYVAAAGATDPYWYCTTTFNPPSTTTRNIRTLATGDNFDSSSDYGNGYPTTGYNAWSILSLDTPCTQTTTEILQITYRIFYNRTAVLTNTNVKSYMLSGYSQKMINTDGIYSHEPVRSFISAQRCDQLVGIFDRGRVWKGGALPTSSGSSLYVEDPGIISVMNGVKQARIVGQFGQSNVSTSADWWLGAAVRSVGWGYPTWTDHRHSIWSPFDKGTTSAVQNVFPKAAYVSGVRRIYLDIPDISLSPAKVNIVDAGNWVNNIDDPVTPYLYRINITTSGTTGTAEYKIQKRRNYQFCTNSWYIQQGIGIPTLPPFLGAGVEGFTIDETYNKRYGFICNYSSGYGGSASNYYGIQHSLRGGWCVKHYCYPQFIGFGQAGITIADVNGKFITMDNYTNASFLCTDILQLANDGSTILIACADTGLWKITRPFDDWDGTSTTITKINPTGITNPNSCRGVTVKNQGAIVEFKILTGGTGYTVGDTVTINTEDAIGSGFVGTVASVGGLGNITGVTITNPGSGYHEDNVAASITSTGGSGAKLVPIVGANGVWWAIFNDLTDNKCILAWTTDAGATWTLFDEGTVTQFSLPNYTSGSPGPVNIIGVHIDPYHPDDRLLIQAPSTVHNVTTSTSTNGQFFWWSRAGSVPSSNQVRANNTTFNYALGEKRVGTLCVGVLNNTNQWITKGTSCSSSGLYNFGSAATALTASNTIAIGPPTTLRGRSGNDVTTCHSGDSTGVHTYKNSTQFNTANNEAICLGNSQAYSAVNHETYESIAYQNGVPNIQYIGKGTYLGWSHYAWQPGAMDLDQRGFTAYTGNGDGTNTSQALLPYGHWENYGWDGTQWVLGNTNSKVTHAAAEPLIDGLTISFDDNSGADSYIINEYYDGFLFDGMLNDNATTFSSYYNIYWGSSERGDTFTPGTVPNSNVGTVIDEPFTVLQEWTNNWYCHPGVVASRAGYLPLVVGEQQLTGDFVFKFKVPAFNITTAKYLDIGVMTWADVVAGNRSSANMSFNMRVQHTTSSPTLQVYSIQCRNSAGGTVVQTVNVTDGSPTDEFSIVRSGSTLDFQRNGITFRTFSTTSTADLAICIWGRSHTAGATLYDGKISYNIARRYVDLGDGALTGRFNTNYGRINHGTNGQNGEMAVYLDGIPATLLTNSYTPPAAGQVNWMRGRGSLWLNDADAGKSVTGKWITALKFNYE